MSKKAGIPCLVRTQLPRSSPFASEENLNPADLVQRARRRLQYPQRPVRCNPKRNSGHQQQQQQQQGKLIRSLKKFPILCTPAKRCTSDKSCRVQNSSYKVDRRKSVSMLNLAPIVVDSGDFEPAELRSDGASTPANEHGRNEDGLSIEAQALVTWTNLNPLIRLEDLQHEARESRAASLVCRVLVINAWRRRRDEVVELRNGLDSLTQQVDHLQIRIVFLKRLLDKENERVATFTGDLHRSKAHMDELTRERDQLKIEKETALGDVQRERKISEERSVTVENLRNELRSTRDQLDALEKQIAKDREKLVKLRDGKEILLEKVSACESLLAERAERADRAESSLEDAQMQLATQIALTNSLQEELHRFSNLLKSKEMEKTDLKAKVQKLQEENLKVVERLEASVKTERRLSLRTVDLESLLFEQESKIRRIEEAYNAQVLELNELRERLIRRSEEGGWSRKVLKLAGSVVCAPRVFLRTLSFFSTGLLLIL